MFLFSAGLVLPTNGWVDQLRQRPEFWQLLLHELREQVFQSSVKCDCALWLTTADGQQPSAGLISELSSLLEHLPGVDRVDPGLLATTGLARWLRSSAAVVFVEPEQTSRLRDPGTDLLRNERLSRALPQQLTLVLQVPGRGDGVTLIERYCGPRPLESDIQFRAAEGLVLYQRSWTQSRQRLAIERHHGALSSNGWHRSLILGWGLKRSQVLMQRRHQGLLWKGLLLMALLLIAAPALQRHTTRFMPGLLLVTAAVLGFSGLPLRQRALHWWVLGHTLWLQDVWHRFGLSEEAAERLPLLQPLDSMEDRGQLLHLLRCHQLWLLQSGPCAAWDRQALTDLLEDLEQHRVRIRRAARRRRLEQGIMLLASVVGACLLLTAIALPGLIWIDQGVLAAAVLLISLWLDRPLPLVGEERMRRHLQTIESELPGLQQALVAENLQDPHGRAAVLARIHRIGSEMLDLANDGIEALTWR